MAVQSERKARIMKPICLNCGLFYRAHRNGAYFTESMKDGKGGWKPYKIWAGDIWKCKGCGSEIISGFGRNPIRIQHEDDFEEIRQRIGANRININDC